MRGTRVNSFVVSTDVHDGRTHVDVFILTQNQRLIYTDMLRYDSSGTPAFVNMLPLTSGFFTFPIDAGSHRTFMYRGSNGLLYILQQGSTQILELNPHPDSTATVRIASFYSPTPCTSNPTFSETPGFIEFNFDGTVVRRPNMQP
jgi:hypothetical protein